MSGMVISKPGIGAVTRVAVDVTFVVTPKSVRVVESELARTSAVVPYANWINVSGTNALYFRTLSVPSGRFAGPRSSTLKVNSS